MEIIIVKWIFNTTPPFKKLWNTKILQEWAKIFFRDNLPIIKDGAYVINLDKYSDIGTHWVALYVQNSNNVIYFDSFGVEHIPKEIKTSINNKNIKINIFGIQEYDSIMCGYFCVSFIDFMLAGKTLTEYTNLFHQIIWRKMMI